MIKVLAEGNINGVAIEFIIPTLKKYDVFAFCGGGAIKWSVNGVDAYNLPPFSTGSAGGGWSSAIGAESWIGEELTNASIKFEPDLEHHPFGAPVGICFVLRGCGNNRFVNGGDSVHGYRLYGLSNPGEPMCERCGSGEELRNDFPIEIACNPGSWVFAHAETDPSTGNGCTSVLSQVPASTDVGYATVYEFSGVYRYADSYILDIARGSVGCGAGDCDCESFSWSMWPTGMDETAGCIISNNVIEWTSTYSPGTGNAIEAIDTDNVSIQDNVIINCFSDAIILNGVIYGNVSSNSLAYIDRTAITLDWVEAVTVDGNMIANASQVATGTLPAINIKNRSYGNFVTSNRVHFSTAAYGPPVTESADPLPQSSQVSYGVLLEAGCFTNTVAFNSMLGAFALGTVSYADASNAVVDNLPDLGGSVPDWVGETTKIIPVIDMPEYEDIYIAPSDPDTAVLVIKDNAYGPPLDQGTYYEFTNNSEDPQYIEMVYYIRMPLDFEQLYIDPAITMAQFWWDVLGVISEGDYLEPIEVLPGNGLNALVPNLGEIFYLGQWFVGTPIWAHCPIDIRNPGFFYAGQPCRIKMRLHAGPGHTVGLGAFRWYYLSNNISGSSSGGGGTGNYTDEMAKDAAAEMIMGGTHTNITPSYNSTTRQLSLSVEGGPHDHTSSDDGGILTNDVHDGYSEYSALGADPATPATGKARFYAKTDAGVTSYFMRTDSGAIVKLGAGGGASLTPAHYDFQPEFINAILSPGSLNNGTLTPYDDATARYNAYRWTTTSVADQTVDIIVRWRLSPRFSAWSGDFKMVSKVSNGAGTNAVELVEFLDGTGANVITPASKKNAAWTEDSFTVTGGTWTPGDILTLRFRLHAVDGEYAYLGPVSIAFNEE